MPSITDPSAAAPCQIDGCRFQELARALEEVERLRAFHDAWVEYEVSTATGNPALAQGKRSRLIALHQAINQQ